MKVGGRRKEEEDEGMEREGKQREMSKEEEQEKEEYRRSERRWERGKRVERANNEVVRGT